MAELVDVERRKAVISVLKDWLVGGDHLILKWEPFADEILAALHSANTVRPEGVDREAIAKIIRQELWDEQNAGRDAEACADRAAERILALRPNDQPGEREVHRLLENGLEYAIELRNQASGEEATQLDRDIAAYRTALRAPRADIVEGEGRG